MDEVLRMYTIYDHPTDYPHHWVVRGLSVKAGGQIVHDAERVLCKTLSEARNEIVKRYPSAVFLTADDPDPHIAEVWI
jgi:hypothetical protein